MSEGIGHKVCRWCGLEYHFEAFDVIECANTSLRAFAADVAKLTTDLAAVTEERDALRQFREDVILVQSTADLDYDDPPYDEETMITDYKLRAAAIRERTKG